MPLGDNILERSLNFLVIVGKELHFLDIDVFKQVVDSYPLLQNLDFIVLIQIVVGKELVVF